MAKRLLAFFLVPGLIIGLAAAINYLIEFGRPVDAWGVLLTLSVALYFCGLVMMIRLFLPIPETETERSVAMRAIAGGAVLIAAVIALVIFSVDRFWGYFFMGLLDALISCWIFVRRYRDYFRLAIALACVGLSAEAAVVIGPAMGAYMLAVSIFLIAFSGRKLLKGSLPVS